MTRSHGQPGGGAAAIPPSGWWTIPVPPIEAELSADVGNSAVLVLATPRSWRIVERALRQLDTPTPQVLIEVRLVEVTLTDELRYGL